MDLSHENHSRWRTSALPANPITGGLSFEVSCRVLCERQDDVDILHGLCRVGGGNAPLDSATSLANHTALAGNLPILVQGLPQLRQLNQRWFQQRCCVTKAEQSMKMKHLNA